MCGIFGYVVSTSRAPDLAVAQRALRHRGPDDSGTFVGRAREGQVGFAHTRLAIIDLSAAGHQPMESRCGRYVVTYNGEIYNYRDVRLELEAAGAVLKTNSDTEVLVEGFARWGKACLSRLRGMFAFALWDREKEVLLLARDRLGVKPLYYVEHAGGIVFSSEVRALLETGAAARRISHAGLATYLLFGSVREPDTMVEGVRALPGGCMLEHASGGAPRIERYWSLPLQQDDRIRREDAVMRFGEILLDSVRLRLVADVPVGVFLSGGMDSAAIVALAARATTSPVHTFTVTFDASEHEGAFAAEAARSFGCVHREAHLATSDIAAHMGKALAALDQPSMDGINTFFVSEAARAAGLVVALSGIGGDELFAGYSSFRRFARARRLASLRLPGAARRSLAAATASVRVPNALRKALALLGSDGGADATYEVLRACFVPGQRDALLAPAIARAHTNGARTMDGAVADALDAGRLDATNAYGALEISNYLLHTLLRDTDAMSMAHSLEVREPLLDHVLVEYAMRVPGSAKLLGEGNKPLLAEAVPEVARATRMRKKSGFVLPFDAWLRGPLRGWAEDALLTGATRHPWMHDRAVASLWRSFAAHGGGVSWSRIWCVAVLNDWCDRHGIGA